MEYIGYLARLLTLPYFLSPDWPNPKIGFGPVFGGQVRSLEAEYDRQHLRTRHRALADRGGREDRRVDHSGPDPIAVKLQ
jgi:hypothetical protein